MSQHQVKRSRRRRVRRQRAHTRIRARVVGTPNRPRLCVYKSLRYIYAQVIDDRSGTTLAAASSLEPEVRKGLDGTGNKSAARVVGETVAARAKAKGVGLVVFDRGGYIFHGKVKELADAARESGLDF